ncbi:MAG: polysaccharide biosynthesis protein [Acidobacteriaceae bacterium]
MSDDDMTGVDWGELLGRPAAMEIVDPPADLHRDQCVFITGTGGSIGCALTMRLAELQPRLLLLLDASEQNLYELDARLKRLASPVPYVAVLGSICDDGLLDELCAQYHPEMLYHTAAHKHVPLMETNPLAVLRNNTLGTYRLAQAAVRNRIHHMLMVSTDKAVHPASMMGASKRMAELALLGCATASTRMTCVRLGNVLGSQGSVAGVFLDQIARGDSVTVTHREAERYFFTMEETVSLILEAASATQDKQILVPETGRPTKILDLANYLIQQKGKPPGGPAIVFTGLRAGEKLYEEFVGPGERLAAWVGPRLHAIDGLAIQEETLHRAMRDLDAAVCARNLESAFEIVERLVPEYRPSASLQAKHSEPVAGHHA